ncbi:MAG: hypothetical protein SGBAC_005861 [Bacillariaceae sp.]
MSEGIIREFVAKQRELLGLEFEAESPNESSSTKSSDDRASHVLASLEVSDISVGLYGRTVVQLSSMTAEKSSEEVLLPAHRFTAGDEVQIRKQNRKDSPTGVICGVADTFVSVALFERKNNGNSNKKGANNNNSNSNNNNKQPKKNDQDADENDFLSQPPFSLVPMSSVEVHKKMIKALDALEKHGANHPICGSVVRAMFDPDLSLKTAKHAANFDAFNANLDASQMEAISFALHSERKIALIHGPPGTGKTTTVAELIYQAVKVHNMKVLVTAPSNVAVDNILERLVATSNAPQPPAAAAAAVKDNKRKNNLKSPNMNTFKAIRLGHPARIKASILKYSLEAQVQAADGTEIVKDVRKELQSYLKVLSNPKSRPNDKRVAYREMKTLRKEIRAREEKVVQELIGTAQVILGTTVGAGNRILEKVQGGFDLVIIDEAAQALEASCWIPVLRGKRVVLAGDHCQLPPTIKARQHQAQVGLAKTMFERLMELYGDDKKGVEPKISRMLQLQYRMHHDIADWASQAMYHGELQTHASVRDRTLSQLEDLQKIASHDESMDELAKTRMLLVDTAGCEYFETVNAAGSRFNHGEANIVAKHVQRLLQMGLDQSQLAIITPYNGQVELLRSMLLQDYPRLEIRSVDGFQGGEREAVVLSLVRSSDRGGKDGIGFLKDDRRQNVAITRAKRHLAVVCDTETVCQSKFIKNLVDWMEAHGESRSAIEYVAGDDDEGYEADLRSAEVALLQMVESEVQATENSKSKSMEQKNEEKKKKDEEIRRKTLMDKIAKFAESGASGEEMKLSTELNSYERMLVHEIAEQLGLGHRSEGTEGVDRRIILAIAKKGSEETKAAAKPNGNDTTGEDFPEKTATVPSFAALAMDDSDSELDDEKEPNEPQTNQEAAASATSILQGNSLMAQLAKERAERQRNQAVSQAASAQQQQQQGGKKKKKKPKGQKLGGQKPAVKQPEEKLDDLDDMAFLDAQIKVAENSHGRKVEGKGQYRTIVNGILNTRPEPRAKPTNQSANVALKSKLKDAQNARKAKPKKKKKK